MGIFCKNCDKELTENERPCSACGCPSRAYKMECETGHYKVTFGALKWKHKRPGSGVIMEGINRPSKTSGDPKLSEGVNEIYVIDKIKKIWHQVVRDLRTGEIIHEENISLEDKNKKLIEK